MNTETRNSIPVTISYEARYFWNTAYVNGCRILYGDGRFTFERSLPPMLRVRRSGNTFGVFPEPEPMEPTPWVLDGIEEHSVALVAWLSQEWPASLKKFAAHVLIENYEFTPLIWYARSIGHRVGGHCGIGGWIPYYAGRQPAQPIPDSAIVMLPPILAGWKGVKF